MKRSIQYIILNTLLVVFLFTSLGCEAFIRKFTRETKKETVPENMVLIPEEEPLPQISKEELYRQYLLFWKSWHNELITALSENANHKKIADCFSEIMKNIDGLRQMLKAHKKKELDIYIARLNKIGNALKEDIYGARNNFFISDAEILKRDILRRFSYSKVEGNLE